MNLNYKYFGLSIGRHYRDELSKLFIDWGLWKPCLRLTWESNYTFYVEIGCQMKSIRVEFKWGYVEREMNQRELERVERVKNMVNGLLGKKE